MPNLEAIVLAAGKSTRMKSKIPKVLHSVYGRPILGYLLDLLNSLPKIKRIVLVLGYRRDLVQRFLKTYKKKQAIRFCTQKRLLGTADAIKSVRGFFKQAQGDVIIIYADHMLLKKQTLLDLTKMHRTENADCTLLTTRMENPAGYGRIIRDKNDKVIGILEENECSSEEKNLKEINTGVYCFKKDVLFSNIDKVKLNNKKKEYYLTDLIEILNNRGHKLQSLRIEDNSQTCGINTRQDLARVVDIWRHRILNDFMDKGITILDPSTTYLYPGVKIGQDTVILPYTFIESDVVIGRRCIIGPFSHLRPGTVLGDDVKIGNFTELTRSRVDSFTKMGHFSYLGDTKVGRHANIGAGTITANFDGINKHKTCIGDGAFIGCDTVLIAPVKVGKKAVTGAGTVLPREKNVPGGKLAIGVPARITELKRQAFKRMPLERSKNTKRG